MLSHRQYTSCLGYSIVGYPCIVIYRMVRDGTQRLVMLAHLSSSRCSLLMPPAYVAFVSGSPLAYLSMFQYCVIYAIALLSDCTVQVASLITGIIDLYATRLQCSIIRLLDLVIMIRCLT